MLVLTVPLLYTTIISSGVGGRGGGRCFEGDGTGLEEEEGRRGRGSRVALYKG